jgi:hypothetical protein
MPQCAVIGCPGHTGQISPAALSQTVNTKSRMTGEGAANSLQDLERSASVGCTRSQVGALAGTCPTDEWASVPRAVVQQASAFWTWDRGALRSGCPGASSTPMILAKQAALLYRCYEALVDLFRQKTRVQFLSFRGLRLKLDSGTSAML